jgi:WD40 repeat protein
MFDPYRKWLGIPEGQRPPTHYQLLGIAPDERDRDVINAAVVRQSAFVRNFQTGEHSEDATRLLNEIAAAKICLLDAAKRAEYDARINPAAKPKPANQSGTHQDLRSSSLLPPPPSPATSSPRQAPAPARSQATLSTPLERPYSPRVTRPLTPAPAMSSPSGVWSDLEPLPATGRSARLKPASKKPPAWLWALPAGSCGLVVIILLAVTLARRPNDAAVSQLNPPTVQIPPAVENYVGGEAGAPSALSPTPSPIRPPVTSANSSAPQFTAPQVTVQTPSESSPPQTNDADADSFQTPPSNNPAPARIANDPADESSVDVEGQSWSDGSSFSIDVPRDAAFTFARANGPFVAVGETVYSLLTAEPVGRARGVQRFNALTSLSADGKYFATADGTTLDVRDSKSGNTLESWQGTPSLSFIEFLEFADADHLITSARSGEQRVQVWDISTGKLSKDVKIEGNLRGATLTADGRYLALVVTNYGIVIYDVLRGPTRGKGKIAARIPITPLERRFIDVDGMRFSPSGEEIAALCDNGTRVLCWKKNTDLVFEHSLGSDLSAFWSGAMSYQGPAIEWAPGGRGWLFKGHTFLDRERRRVTWFLKTEHDSQARHRFIDDDRLLVVRGRGDDRELVDLKIPWQKIDDSFAAMKDPDVAAWLGPQAPAAVRVKVTSAADGTSTEQLAAELTQLFAARMGDDGVRIAESGAAVFAIDYSETYQPPQTISSPAQLRMRINIPARQIPGHTNCTMTIHFHANGNPIDLWTTTIHASAQDDPKVGQRSAVYAELGRKLQSAVLPIFIPKDKNLVALPAVIRP